MAANRSVSCIMLTPYTQFKDGTQGCILVIDWQEDAPAVFLFNSLERQSKNKNARTQQLSSLEQQMLLQYIKEGEQERYFFTGDQLKQAYSTYGVARLCGNFISAHIADMIGENINAHHPQSHKDTSRIREMLANAHLRYTNYNLEDELLLHMSEDSVWERSLIAQALPPIAKGYDHNKWLQLTLLKIRTSFADILDHLSIPTGIEFGLMLSKSYEQDNNAKWWRELEKVASVRYRNEFRYIDYGIQEIIAFYGLAVYISEKKPFSDLVLYAGKLPLEKRVDIFKAYKEQVEKECLEELRNADNPLLSSMPTKQDAQKEAKVRMQQNLGRTPNWLPKEHRHEYSLYEQAFCRFAGIGNSEPTKEKKKILYAKERAGIRAVHESGICQHKADWGAVFKILVEKDIFSDTAYLAAAVFINEICTIDVTTKDALRQSPALNILGGAAESGWRNRAPENRESGRKLLFYRKIAEIFFGAF